MEKGIRHFIFLKSRQMGCTTLFLALDLFWLLTHKGVSIAIVADKVDTMLALRQAFRFMVRSLPKEVFDVEILGDDKDSMIFPDGRVVYWRHAGSRRTEGDRAGGRLGRGTGLTCAHMTELGYWKHDSEYDAIQASFSEMHPGRFVVEESTAGGANLFKELWEQAYEGKMISKRAIFLPWWRDSRYDLPMDGPAFQHYVNAEPLPDEQEWVEEIKRRYDVELRPSQIAWYRYIVEEKYRGMVTRAYEEFPPLPEMAFQYHQNSFFSFSVIKKKLELLNANPPPELRIGFEFGTWMHETKASENPEGALTVWEKPDPGFKYAAGCDPKYGSLQSDSAACISVWKCYSNKMVQVAEFNDPWVACSQLAWVLAYLSGLYAPLYINIELGGGGYAVFQELQRIQNEYTKEGSRVAPGSGSLSHTNFLDSVMHYIWRKPDSLAGGGAYHWKTNHDSKLKLLHQFRDAFTRDLLVIRSSLLYEQMSYFLEDENDVWSEETSDRVIAAGLAVQVFFDVLYNTLVEEKVLWSEEKEVVNLHEEEKPVNSFKIPTRDELLKHCIYSFIGQQLSKPKDPMQIWREKKRNEALEMFRMRRGLHQRR
jgi:hypothetical protein